MSAAKHEHGPSCREMFEKLSEYIDGELPADLCDRIDGHMDDCPPCRRYLESLRRTVRILEATPLAMVPDDVHRELEELGRKIRD